VCGNAIERHIAKVSFVTALRGIDVRLRLARLLCVTDARRRSGDLGEFAAGVMNAGVDLIQLRDDRATDAEKLSALDVLRTAALRPQGLVSVYADLDLAREFGADVLHVPKGRPDSERARRALHRWAKLGRSCYTTKDVDAALADDRIDFLTVGPTFGGLPLFGRPPGLELVRYAAEAAPPAQPGAKPWFAMGGITLFTLDDVLAAGARRVAVGRAICAADDPLASTKAFATAVGAAWADAMDTFTLDAVAKEGSFRPIVDETDDPDRPTLEPDSEPE
jgi:thiamine-phosphate pyrophosphorylase